MSDVLVIDVPWTADEQFLQTIATVNHVILVAEQNLPSLRSLRLVLDMLNQANLTKGAGGLAVEVVVNRYDPRSKDFPLERVKEVLESPNLSTIANDYPSVNASVNRGVPLRLERRAPKALADIEALTSKLFGNPEVAKKDSGWKWFGRLANVFAGSPK